MSSNISAPSPQASHSAIPELAGPGDEHDNGTVTFGQPVLPRVVIPSRRDKDEVARERKAATQRCSSCAGIPAELLTALHQALHAARAEGARQVQR